MPSLPKHERLPLRMALCGLRSSCSPGLGKPLGPPFASGPFWSLSAAKAHSWSKGKRSGFARNFDVGEAMVRGPTGVKEHRRGTWAQLWRKQWLDT